MMKNHIVSTWNQTFWFWFEFMGIVFLSKSQPLPYWQFPIPMSCFFLFTLFRNFIPCRGEWKERKWLMRRLSFYSLPLLSFPLLRPFVFLFESIPFSLFINIFYAILLLQLWNVKQISKKVAWLVHHPSFLAVAYASLWWWLSPL